MMRWIHSWLGLGIAVLLCVTALSGAALSFFPAQEAARAPSPEPRLTVAALAARVQANHPGIEQIQRAPSGKITAWWFEGEQPGSATIDPTTGLDIATTHNPVQRWLTTLHRSLFLDDAGRIATALGALAMLVLSVSGTILVVRRCGGWKAWFAQVQGPTAGRLHTQIGRVVVLGLLLSCSTGLWMAAETFDLLPVEPAGLDAAAQGSGLPPQSLDSLEALQAIPVTQLRKLSFPAPTDAQDVLTVTTEQGMGYVDPGTGAVLRWQNLGWEQQISDTIAMLHTGQGAAVLGLILGAAALCVPILSITGLLLWWRGHRARATYAHQAPAARAETVVLVGSEGGSTWGFATTLADALHACGQRVHVASMSDWNPARYRQAQRFLVLTSTYGQGQAPTGAQDFLQKMKACSATTTPIAVLGFGDRSFPDFCAFAALVERTVRVHGWPSLLPYDTIDRQSPQDFARWGRMLGEALGIPLELAHQPVRPATQTLTLVERRDYGTDVQVPVSILRFALPSRSVWQRLRGTGFAPFEPGDLLGILPAGSDVPRMYSLASGSQDGFIEIVVRRHLGGLASGQLTQLTLGQTVQGFLRHHPAFHAPQGRAPLVLIGAGTGIGPLAGFIRANAGHRPIHLFFGLRRIDSDFLYQQELTEWQAAGRLSSQTIAVSRSTSPQYVQDALRQASPQVLEAMHQGAIVMVCGGRAMAQGVRDALTEMLTPTGQTLHTLQAEHRYVEDIY